MVEMQQNPSWRWKLRLKSSQHLLSQQYLQKHPQWKSMKRSKNPRPAQTEEETTADNSARIEPTLQPNGMEKSAPGETFAQEVPIEAAPQVQPAPPIGATLQIVLAVIAILSAIIALTLRYTTIRKWRAKAK